MPKASERGKVRVHLGQEEDRQEPTDHEGKKDLSQAELAEALGVAQGHYSNIELGKRQLSLHLLAKICEMFGVDPAEIIADIDEPSTSPDPEDEKAEV